MEWILEPALAVLVDPIVVPGEDVDAIARALLAEGVATAARLGVGRIEIILQSRLPYIGELVARMPQWGYEPTRTKRLFRLPPDRIIGRQPGEVFVHRNVANVVVHTDINCLSVLQYGIEVLEVKHVIVCGHYGCGGVEAALQPRPHGLIDNWLRHIRDVHMANRAELETLPDAQARADRLCELNVVQHVANVCHTTIVQDAWARGRPLTVHGWIYSLADGLLRDLGLVVERPEQLPDVYRMA